ncbi:hypothetical protein G6011_10020 [Alternaria panax]|uniref:Uncharacterized protein n=1 Tax=Alternaria panax TaxID=48097 RepID=A0AAD4I677_9PLEO|nr:hypothetical protein G6011_10020 [Alternaria panax]
MPIACIDRTGPPTALLVTCRYLCDEIRAYFIASVTLGFVQQRMSCLQTIDPISLSAIERAKKIRVRMSWYEVPRTAIDIGHWPYRVNGWLADLVKLLLEKAKSLELITVSCDEPDWGTEWEQKMQTLAPLKRHCWASEVPYEAEDAVLNGQPCTFTKMLRKETELKKQLALYIKELNEVALPATDS